MVWCRFFWWGVWGVGVNKFKKGIRHYKRRKRRGGGVMKNEKMCLPNAFFLI